MAPDSTPKAPAFQAMATVFEGGRAAVRKLRKAKLVVTSGPDAGREVDMGTRLCTGGRSIINDLVLADKAVSGTHFKIVADEDGYRLVDLESRNGTTIGELRVREVYLTPGMSFRVGQTELRFQTAEDIVEIALSK